MFRHFLSVGLALLVAFGIAAVAKADVQGSFDISIQLFPEGTQTEAVKLKIDLQSNLQVDITLSGLTFGADLGFGTTGVEFAILSLSTNLGALQVFDEFVFAEPFGCVSFAAGVGNGPDTGADCSGSNVVPIGAGSDENVNDHAVGFVKKRIDLTLNIAGVTLNNLAIFEDVDFPDISAGGTGHEHDHFDGSTLYNLFGVDNVVDNQTPTYGFGDVVSISGQTVSGITVSGSTTFCASGTNTIKKRSWTYEVNKACTAQFGMNTTALEGGAKTPILFEEETLDIEGIELGSVGLDINVTFKPLKPVNADITATFSVLDIFDVTTTFSSNNLTALSLGKITSVVSSGNFVFTLVDKGGDLKIDSTTSTLSVVLNANQNPADLTVSADTDTTGITALQLDLGISRSGFTFSTTTKFSGSGTLSWASTSFSFDINSDVLAVGTSLSYGPKGMSKATIDLGVVF